MTIKVLSIGKTKKKYLRQGMADYRDRLKHYTKFQYLEKSSSSKKQIVKDIQKEEATWFEKNIKERSLLVLLDENGKLMHSRKFAQTINHWQVHTQGEIVFAIGGAYGFSDDLKQRADFLLSLSPMTYSHQLIRLIFLEQLYRAFTILAGEKYHND